jgi:hypothetical protein
MKNACPQYAHILLECSPLDKFSRKNLDGGTTVKIPHPFFKGCLFHLGQNIWRQIQEGLAQEYGSDINLSLKLCHLFILAFVPSTDIVRSFDTLKHEMHENTKSVVAWFEEIYVYDRIRVTLRNAFFIKSNTITLNYSLSIAFILMKIKS